MGDRKELRIGVIGAGGRGALAGHAHNPQDGIRLVAAADIRPAALEEFQRSYGPDVLVTSDYRELLRRGDVEAVFVTTPDYLHEEHAVAALEAGKHVYLEKPMAITIEGCDRILMTAMRRGRKLYLGHNMRHMAFTRKMKELVDGGAIGAVKAGWCRHFVCYGGDAYFKDWHAERSKATSLLLQKGAHDIDILHWLCGAFTRRVTAMGNLSVYNLVKDRRRDGEAWDTSWHLENWPPLSQKKLNPLIDVEDLSMVLMELDNGALASYQQCHYAPDGWRNYTIIGTEGRIENFGDNPGDCTVRLWSSRSYYKAAGDREFPIPTEQGSHGGADPRIVAEFVRFVREGGVISTSPVAARNSVAVGCMGARSLRSASMPIDIPPIPADVLEYFSSTRR